MSGHPDLHAILVGDGDVSARSVLDAAWPGWDTDALLVVAADGGATKALAAGLAPDLVVGDADSLGPAGLAALREAGIPFELAAEAKDESDLELAVLAAVARGASRLTILGALGGPRFDHALANAWLLAHPALDGRAAVLLDATTRVRLLDATAAPAAARLAGAPGDLVSLFPFGADALGVATAGLAYPLRDEPLRIGPARGLSNVRSGPQARVALRAGRLLIVETHLSGGQNAMSSSAPSTSPRGGSGWRTRDILVTAVIGAAFGVLMAALNAVYAGLGAGPGSPWLLVYLGWLLPAVLAPVIVQKPGAGLFAELVAASVSLLVVSQWGPDALVSGFLQGLGAEAVFAAFRYRRFDVPVIALAGAASAALAFVHDTVVYYQGVAPEVLALTFLWMVISAAVLMPLVTVAIVRGLREAGVLRGFPG